MVRRPRFWEAVALALALALPTTTAAQGLQVFGYGNIEYLDRQDGNSTFDAHNFNVVLLGKLLDGLFAAGEVEYEHGGDEIALEYGYLAFTRWRYLNITAGKFIMPFGRFNQNHPAWINRVPGRPFGFANVLPATYSEVGLLVGGALGAGHLSRITYDAWWVNGLAGADGGDLRDMRDNVEDVDRNKFVGGRVGYFSQLGVDVGLSYHTGTYDAANDLGVTFIGVDATYHRGNIDVRGEYVTATQESSAGDLDKKGFYVQGAYLLALKGVPPIEPAVRFSQQEFPGGVSQDLQEISLGGSLYLSDLGAVRVFYRLNKQLNVTEVDDDQFIAQFTVAF